MSKILIIDTERGAAGFKSMQNVTIMDASATEKQTAFEKVEEILWAMHKDPTVLKEYSHLAIDTISSLSTVTRHELMSRGPQSLWAQRGIYSSDTRSDYRATNDMMARLLQYFRKLPVTTIFVAHEEERLDPSGITKRGPSLSPGLLKDVIQWSHIIAHLGQTSSKIKLPSGKEIPAGTRRLRIEPDARYMAKARHRVDLPPLPPVIIEPNLADLMRVLEETGEPNSWATLYGPPGVGKSSLVVGAEYRVKSNGKVVDAVVEQDQAETKEEAVA